MLVLIIATGWRKRGDEDPKGLRDLVKQRLNEKVNPAGEVFNYSSIQTDILSMIIEGASGKSIAEFFDDLVNPNEKLKAAFENYRETAPNGHYRSQFWVIDAKKNQFVMIGIHGQLAYFDYDRDFAMITFGAYPIAKDFLILDCLEVLRDALLQALLPDYRDDDEDFDLLSIVDK